MRTSALLLALALVQQLAGLRTLDSKALQEIQRWPFPALIRLDGPECDDDECLATEQIFERFPDSWKCPCGEQPLVCRNLGFSGRTSFVVLMWDGAQMKPYTGRREIESMFNAYYTLLEQSKSKILEARMELVGPRNAGKLPMATDKLPAWFQCTRFKLVSANPTESSILTHFIPQSVSEPYAWRGKRWELKWKRGALEGPALSSGVAIWWGGLDQSYYYEYYEEDATPHQLTVEHNPFRKGDLQHCSLPWGDARIEYSLDTSHAFSWMHHDYLHWPRFIAKLAMEVAGESAPILLDATCGSGWLPLLVKALLRERVRVICSDISAQAIRQARQNFEANHLEGETLVGDYMHPAKQAGIKADLVYVHPPQDVRPKEKVDMNQPEIAIWTESRLFFFERAIAEAPSVLRPGGALLLGVGKWLVDDVLKLLAKSGWHLSRSMPALEDVAGENSFFCPSVLLEVRRVGDAAGTQPGRLCGEACGKVPRHIEELAPKEEL